MFCIIEIWDFEINELLYFFNFEENNGFVCKFKLIDVCKFIDFFFLCCLNIVFIKKFIEVN